MNSPESPPQVQTDFDFIVPVQRPLLKPDEVAGIMRYDRSTIYDMTVSGELEMHRRPGLEKAHQRITRRSLVGFLTKTANYDTADFSKTLFDLAKTLTPQRRRELAHRLLTTP